MCRKISIRTLRGLLLAFSLCASSDFLLSQGFSPDWPELHKKDLSKWAAKSGLSTRLLGELAETATHHDAKDVEDGYFQYFIENVDAKTLSKQKQILFSTWAPGTGHCLTLYMLKKEGTHFEKIWQSYDNLCTRSILGAAETQAMRDGRITVRYREYSVDSDPKKAALPVLRITVTYRWDGATYTNAGRTERPEPTVSTR
jgi:hypothetical protein